MAAENNPNKPEETQPAGKEKPAPPKKKASALVALSEAIKATWLAVAFILLVITLVLAFAKVAVRAKNLEIVAVRCDEKDFSSQKIESLKPLILNEYLTMKDILRPENKTEQKNADIFLIPEHPLFSPDKAVISPFEFQVQDIAFKTDFGEFNLPVKAFESLFMQWSLFRPTQVFIDINTEGGKVFALVTVNQRPRKSSPNPFQTKKQEPTVSYSTSSIPLAQPDVCDELAKRIAGILCVQQNSETRSPDSLTEFIEGKKKYLQYLEAENKSTFDQPRSSSVEHLLDQARTHFAASLYFDPEFYPAELYLGDCLIQQNRLETAIVHIKNAAYCFKQNKLTPEIRPARGEDQTAFTDYLKLQILLEKLYACRSDLAKVTGQKALIESLDPAMEFQPDPSFWLAYCQWHIQDYSKAIDILSKIKNYPGTKAEITPAQTNRYLGKISLDYAFSQEYSKTGFNENMQKAVDYLNEAIKCSAQPLNRDLKTRCEKDLAQIYMYWTLALPADNKERGEKKEKFENISNAILQEYPLDTEVNFYKGLLLSSSQEYDEAFGYYQKTLLSGEMQELKRHPDFYYWIGIGYLRRAQGKSGDEVPFVLDDLEMSYENLTKFLVLSDRPPRQFSELVYEYPYCSPNKRNEFIDYKQLDAYWYIAVCFQEKHNPQFALDYIQQALLLSYKLNKDAEKNKAELVRKIHSDFHDSLENFKKVSWDKRIQYFFNLLNSPNPADSQLLADYLEACCTEDPAKRKAKLSSILREYPEMPDANADLGILLFREGNYAGAVQRLDTAIKLDNDSIDAHYYRILSCLGLIDQGRKNREVLYQKAEESFFTAKQYFQKCGYNFLGERFYRANFMNIMGLLNYLKGKYLVATVNFQDALSWNEDPLFYLNLALAYYKLGDMDNTLSNYYAAVALNPEIAYGPHFRDYLFFGMEQDIASLMNFVKGNTALPQAKTDSPLWDKAAKNN